MSRNRLSRILESPWALHLVCCILALVGCLPILWPTLTPKELHPTIVTYAGIVILTSFITSGILMVATIVHFLLRMRNLRASGQFFAWLLQWSVSALIFAQMAIKADVSSPYEENTAQTIQNNNTLYPPTDKLNGASALVIPIDPSSSNTDFIADAPNLLKLEKEHEELLSTYLNQSPRWAYAAKETTFYTQPGHVVLTPPPTGGIPGTVHASFRTIVEGEPLPEGFIPVTPGSPFPQTEGNSDKIPDIALDLSGKHYLLLAWRGTTHSETARKALNAAITAIDSRLQRLAETPTQEVCHRLCTGKSTMLGSAPELRVSEPSGQYGVYQAEVYANPGRAGTLLLVVRDIDTGKVLRLFSFPAQYSDNKNELFRHDIPGPSEAWQREAAISDIAAVFPTGAPFFAIAQGESHHYFGVSFEVQFSPSGTHGADTETLLRRNYKVQAYESTPTK